MRGVGGGAEAARSAPAAMCATRYHPVLPAWIVGTGKGLTDGSGDGAGVARTRNGAWEREGTGGSRRGRSCCADRSDGWVNPDVRRRETRANGFAPARAVRRVSGVASGPPARQA
eukprot:6099306-Pleurochrysis_carterae.AAC.1